mgnify:CR=1 FL=1
MWILIISIISFAIIMFIVNLIDKNKEKIIEKFKIEKKEIMKCPHCFREYEDLKLKECKYCNIYLEKNIKYIFPKKLKKKIIYSILGIVAIMVIGIGTYLGITNYINEQQRIEKYNNDVSTCYEVIKNDSDFKKFTSIIEEHTEETNFPSDAYKKLYQAIDERIENIKNGNDDEKLINMIKEIKSKNSSNQTIANKYLKANGYSNINKANKYIQEQKYVEAYELLGTVITDNKDINKEITDLATNKQNEIKEQMLQQVISQGQEKINNKDYSSAQTLLRKYKDLGNQTIVDMYNNATNEVNRIEAEKKAQEEAEERARIEKERFDYEVYCYFNLIAVKQNLTSDDVAYSKCASKFGITKAQAKQSYQTVNSKGGWWYQDEYPDIFEKYASQY